MGVRHIYTKCHGAVTAGTAESKRRWTSELAKSSVAQRKVLALWHGSS